MGNTLHVQDRLQWREWLMENRDKETEIWLILPKKSSGKQRIPYADTVEEALCFGWIDSTVKKLDEHHTARAPRIFILNHGIVDIQVSCARIDIYIADVSSGAICFIKVINV